VFVCDIRIVHRLAGMNLPEGLLLPQMKQHAHVLISMVISKKALHLRFDAVAGLMARHRCFWLIVGVAKSLCTIHDSSRLRDASTAWRHRFDGVATITRFRRRTTALMTRTR
jgi:hypothetical protein